VGVASGLQDAIRDGGEIVASILIDVYTRGLDDAIRNVAGASKLITAGTAVRMERWYNNNMKNTMLNIIESGDGVANNVGKYAIEKRAKYGIDHGLGFLTGGLYFGISSSVPNVKETRGKEVRMYIKFNDPYYVAYVVEGTEGATGHIGRDFVTLARDKDWHILLEMVGSMFDGLDFTRPYPELMSTVMGPHLLPSLRSYG
jgi:hypothetical protein